MTKIALFSGRAGLILAVIIGAFRPMPASAEAYEPNAAINEEWNETTSFAGATRVKTIDTTSRNRGTVYSVVPYVTYTLEASGTYLYDGLLSADAECTAGPEGKWKARRTVLGGIDEWDIMVDQYNQSGVMFDWTPRVPITDPNVGERACSADHRYTATLVHQGGTDLYAYVENAWGNSTGTLSLSVSRPPFDAPRQIDAQTPYQCGKRSGEAWTSDGGRVGEIHHAELTIDSFTQNLTEASAKDSFGNHLFPYWYQSGVYGVYSCNWALPGSVYRITVSGTWKYDSSYAEPYARADASCTTGYSDANWIPTRYPADPMYAVNTWTSGDTLDVYINGRWVGWQPNAPMSETLSKKCSKDHTYVLPAYSPADPGPIRFQVYDWAFQSGNNEGQLTVTVDRIA